MPSPSIQHLYRRAWMVPIIVGSGALAVLLLGAYRVAMPQFSTFIDRIVQRCVMGVSALLTPTTAAALGIGVLAAVVALTFVVSLFIQIVRTRRLLSTLTICRSNTENARAFGRFIPLATETPLCFTAGLFRPQIFVSTGTLERLTEAELSSVLAHEAHHAAHRDPLKAIILRAFAHAFFFLPLFRAFAKRMKATNEIAADAAACSSPRGRAALATALFTLSHHHVPVPTGVASFAASGTIDIRLEFMGGRMSVPFPITLSKIVVSAVVFFILLVPTVSVSRAETVVTPCVEHPPFVHPKNDTRAFEYVLPTPVPWKPL